MKIKKLIETDDDWSDENYIATEEDLLFADDLFTILQDLVTADDNLTEEFMSGKGASEHYRKHCIGKDCSKKSIRTRVYYDFRDVSQYKEYERKLADASRSASGRNLQAFSSLLDRALIEKWLRRLFEGGKYIIFTTECGFHNSLGQVSLVIHSFASNVTHNYQAGNTIDIMVKGRNGMTITLYPVDASYFETKLNNIIRKYTDLARSH